MMGETTRFDNLESFVDAASRNPAAYINAASSSPSWFGGIATLSDAVTMARQGWPTGTAKITRLSNAIVNKVTSLIEVPQVQFDVCGLDFDMGMHLSGVPESWYELRYQTQEGHGFKHVHIVANFSVSGGISADVIESRGAIVAALVLSLETAQVRVTLDTVCAISEEANASVWVRLKEADQPLDIDRLAFALVHPAMLRWLLLSLKPWSYRTPDDVPKPMQGDIYIAKGFLLDKQWADVDTAQAWILEQLTKQGVQLTQGGSL